MACDSLNTFIKCEYIIHRQSTNQNFRNSCSQVRKKAFSFICGLFLANYHGVLYLLFNASPPFKQKDSPVTSAQPHKMPRDPPCSLVHLQCTPNSAPLHVCVQSLSGVGIGSRDHRAGVKKQDGRQPFLRKQGGGGKKNPHEKRL